jgi:hypothetical protein
VGADDLLQSVYDAFDRHQARARALITTTIHSFYNSVTVTEATDLGIEQFALIGPDDSVIREWCEHWVERRGTIAQFEATAAQWGRENQPLPVAAWRGGWNCRHDLVPLFDEDLKQYEEGPR